MTVDTSYAIRPSFTRFVSQISPNTEREHRFIQNSIRNEQGLMAAGYQMDRPSIVDHVSFDRAIKETLAIKKPMAKAKQDKRPALAFFERI